MSSISQKLGDHWAGIKGVRPLKDGPSACDKAIVNEWASFGTSLETHSSKTCFLSECGETGDSKSKTVGPLAHASIRMKVEESGRLLCDKAALLVHMLVGLEALPSSLGPLVLPFLAECPDCGDGGARKDGGRGNSC